MLSPSLCFKFHSHSSITSHNALITYKKVTKVWHASKPHYQANMSSGVLKYKARTRVFEPMRVFDAQYFYFNH